ncbi:thrombospondin type-1 domain-containing protein, partial [Candidatus Gottesmanbacteria bacterium]|nr:thrombospondin type-1 domain-containing protein [Candidatus Gottesmanbacteria bacterium]
GGTQTRSCTNNCGSNWTESQSCNSQSCCTGVYGNCTDWSACSVSCGGGIQSRTCYDTGCGTAQNQIQSCNNQSCPRSQTEAVQAVYYHRGDIETSGNWELNENDKIVILIDGNLKISQKITVPQGAFLAFIVKGDIIIDKTLGVNPESAAEKAIEGVYITNGFFRTVPEGEQAVPNKKFVGAGIFVADADLDGSGGFELGRDLGGNNNLYPAEYFEYRPDFLANFPKELSRSKVRDWQEVAP